MFWCGSRRTVCNEWRRISPRHFIAPVRRSSIPDRSAQRLSSSTAAAGMSSRNRLEVLKPDEVYYFAFGSNMNPAVLTGRRLVQPSQSLPCSLPTHRLSFGVQGMPYSEPGFATVVEIPQQEQQQQRQQQPPQPQRQQVRPLQKQQQQQQQQPPCAHGVVHRITRLEWAYVKASEGVGSRSIGYQVVPVQCHLYDGSVVQALTLQAAAASMHTGRTVLPSQRYLSLLQEGGYVGTPQPANRPTRIAARITNPTNPLAAADTKIPAATAAPGGPTEIEAAPSSGTITGSSRAQRRQTRDENSWGYQVKLFGPRRTATTVAQVRAAGLNAVAQLSGGDVPCDLLTGRAFWAGQTAIVFTMPA
ncbi:hypothetical protein COO60DRAFT_511779 [Scenedesmus sp. NREL 46B-D3]|nr:hypothetical protein COO60DRAFT_511779 [Scenedesmus sp. NREL 46B-D3]